MIKIKLNLFEGIFLSSIIPTFGFVFNTFILILCLFKRQDDIVYKCIMLSYIAYLFMFMLFTFICYMIIRIKKKELIIFDDKLSFSDKTYDINDISYCEYCKCKWYFIPILYVYKQQSGGLFTIRFYNGKKISFRIFYSDFVKIKNAINPKTIKIF